jgi:hypothetical protein
MFYLNNKMGGGVMIRVMVFNATFVLCNVVPFFYHHSVVIQHLVSDRLLSLISKENVHNVR